MESHPSPPSTKSDSSISRPAWPGPDRSRFSWNLAFLGILWADVFWTLQTEWEINEQYSFGYLMPFLGLYLLYLRWEDRPAVAPANRMARLELPAAILLLLLLLPLRVLFMANPDWRLLMWAHTGIVWGYTLYKLAGFGGRSWLLHFAPAFTFFLLAVPWPSVIEVPLVQGLMRLVAQVSVEVINILGIHAVQQGNLIQLPRGLVGVEEACSGVRSFQSALMAGYFFSEWFRFKWPFRLALIGVGLALSILLNLLRTLTLTLVTHFEGGESMQRWHDPVGYFVYFGSFGLIFLAAFLLMGVARQHRHHLMPKGKFLRGDPSGLLGKTALAVLVALWGGTVAGAELFYRAGQSEPAFFVDVRPTLDQVDAPVRKPEIPPQTRALLRYSEGLMATWRDRNASWTLYFFDWEAGDVSSFAGVHRPEICLQAAGLVLDSRHEPLVINRGPFDLVMETYTFRSGERQYHVFFGVWERKDGRNVPVNQSPEDRLANVLNRSRSEARQSLQVVIMGMPDMGLARAAASRFLDYGLQVDLETPES